MAGLNISLKAIVFTLCVSLLSIEKSVSASRLNVPRVLLPVINEFPVNFTLEVTEGGCYQWSTSRLDVIRLIPTHENSERTCSSAVMVQSIAREPTRNTAIVLAEDINTGQFLRCDVIVDAIFSLNLVTTSRELFIAEAPEAFEVRAYDEQGNEFTTLAGVEFEWYIGGVDRRHSDNEHNRILRFMTFQESPYETPPDIAMLDGTGKTGNIVLLEGIKTGTTKISVRLPYPIYKHVPAVEVELIVVANLIILPTDVTMMAFDSFKYRIMQVQHGRLEEISLPSTQYYLEAENPTMLEINNDRRTAYALAMGKTKVLLHDKNVHEEYGVVLPTATVNINQVAYITIMALPNRNSGLILGQTHEIVVELFDSKDHKFHIGEGVEVTMDIDSQVFETKSVTQNGTHVVVVPIACSTTIVEARLHGVINKQGEKIPLIIPLVAKAELFVHTPVIVSPRILAVPWDPKSKSRLDVALKASGGDGQYMWSSRDPSIITVSQNGVVRALNKGSTDVTASMARNRHNNDRVKVHVLVPSRLKIIQYNLESAIDEPINLHLALYGKLDDESPDSMEIPFNDCRDLSFEIHISDDTFSETKNETVNARSTEIGCAVVTIVAKKLGTSGITVAYRSNGQYLLDNVTVSSYEPLLPIYPKTAECLLAVGTSRKIVFKGGPPGSWTTEIARENYKRRIIVTGNETIVRTIDQNYTEMTNVNVYEVTCVNLGDVVITYAVTNDPKLANCRGSEARANVRVICGVPRTIKLLPEFRDTDNCPIGKNTDRVMAHSDKPLRLDVRVEDDNGRVFDNVSSLTIDWILKPVDSAIVQIASGIREETFVDMNVVLPRTHYQVIVPKKHTGSLAVVARMTGYKKTVLARSRVTSSFVKSIDSSKSPMENSIVEAGINVFLVNYTTITPNRIKILNDPNVKYSLRVSQGSGYYEFVLSNEEIADIRYVEPTKTIGIIPKRSGIVKLGLIDLCLISATAEAEIEVQELSIIEVETVDKIEKGKSIVATVRLFDSNGNPMELESIDAIKINVETDENLAKIERLGNVEHGDGPYSKIFYLIRGIEVGETRIIFTSTSSNVDEITSESSSIEIFPPLVIVERNITVLVGTLWKIETTGGPTNAHVEFFVENENILSIDKRGIIEGRSQGRVKLVARAVGYKNNNNGDKIVYSQDEVYVYVTHMRGVKIVVPTTRIKVGAVVPLWAFGIPDNLTPLVIGSMKSSLLSFSWTSENLDLLSLHNMYESTGINIRYQNEVGLRARALKPGLATVYLNITTPIGILTNNVGNEASDSFGSFVKIEIFEELALTHPDKINGTNVLIMEPNSILKLMTNRDKHGVGSYAIVSDGRGQESDDPNAITSTSTRIVTVDKNGVVRSGDNYGRTIISITNVEAYNFKQTITVVVEVKPINYMMLALNSNIRIRTGEELNVLPKGMELDYVVEYFDSVGNKFHATRTEFKTATNRADLVSFTVAKENRIIAKFNEDGELVAKIHSVKYPNSMFDYVHMMIGDIIFPTKTTLTVGDVVCFSMPLLAVETGDPGSWLSSSPEILSVDPTNGIGRAKNPGHTVVRHSLTRHKQYEIDVNVQPMAKISLVLLRGKNFTGTEVFSVPLVLKSKDEGIKENNVLARGLGGCRTHSSFTLGSFPFKCDIQFASPLSSVNIKELFLTKPRFDIVTGFYYCDIIPLGLSTIITSTIDTRVQVNAQGRGVVGTPLEIAYLPPIFVSTKDIIFVQTIGQPMPTATLEIYGLPSVLDHATNHIKHSNAVIFSQSLGACRKIQTERINRSWILTSHFLQKPHNSGLSVEVPEGVAMISRQFITKHSVHYKFRLIQDQEDIQSQKIIILNELSKQNISLPIRTSKSERYTSISGIHWVDYIYFYRYPFVTLAVLLFTFLYFWKNRVASVNLSVRNSNVFADRCPPPMKKSPTINSTTLNTSTNSSSPRSPGSPSPLRPFSAFEPVYGDPRGFYTPNARRSYSFQSP